MPATRQQITTRIDALMRRVQYTPDDLQALADLVDAESALVLHDMGFEVLV